MYNKNELFVSDEVRDYIKNINNLIKSGNTVITETLNTSLYIGLCILMYQIFDFGSIEIQESFKKYLTYIVNSNDTIENKKNKIKIFIDFLKINSRGICFKKVLVDTIDDLLLLFGPNNNKNEENIIFILKCLNLENIINNDMLFYDDIRKKLKNNPEDAKLFLEFFNIVECNDEYCNIMKNITDYKNKNGRFILKKNENTIKLLEIFNGKSVKVIVTENDIFIIKQYKENYNNHIIQLTKTYVKKTISDIKNDLKSGGENIQNGGGFLDLFKLQTFVDILENSLTEILTNIYDTFILYSKKVSELFKLDWLSLGGIITIPTLKSNYDNSNKYNFIYNYNHFKDYIYNFLYNKISVFIKLLGDQKNFMSSIAKKIKSNSQLYLEERSKPHTDILNFFGVSTDVNNFSNSIENKISAKINSFLGGGSTNCFILPNLKQSLLKVLINVYNINMIELYMPDKFEKCDILNNNSYTIITIPYNKLDCLVKTNLFRKNKKNKKNNISEIWTNTNKILNSQNISINNNYFQILKDSQFSKDLNYHIGGSNEDIIKNTIFIKTKNTTNNDIEMDYSYQIIYLLQKALTKLNNNGIYLEKEEINKIQNNIDILKNSEKKLVEYAKNITNAIKISNVVSNKNKLLNAKTLEQYVNEHKILLESSDKIALQLNTVFIKFIELAYKLE